MTTTTDLETSANQGTSADRGSTAGLARGLRVAYLNSQYPKASHTFIEREIRSLRALGAEIHPFSVRPPGASDTLGEANASAAKETESLLDSRMKLLIRAAAEGLRRPIAALRGLMESQRLASAGLDRRLRHVAYWAEALRLAGSLRRRGLSHVHVHMANNGAAVALLAGVIDPAISYSLSLHGAGDFLDPWRIRLAEKIHRATAVRCISWVAAAQAMSVGDSATAGSIGAKIGVVRCGIEPGRYENAWNRREWLSPAPAGPLGTPRRPMRIVCVARLVPIKGHPVLLEACAALDRRGVAWELEIIGDGPTQSRLREQAASLGLTGQTGLAGERGVAGKARAGRVNFRGAQGQDAVAEAYARADVMALASFIEGVPVVLMEAMASGLAVVATGVGGVAELVEHGRTGLIVRPTCAASLADALERLAREEGLIEALARAGRARVMEEFTDAHTAAGMARVLHEAVSRGERNSGHGRSASRPD